MQPARTTTLEDRLRANLLAAAIPAPEVDVERLIEEGAFARMEPYLRALRDVDDSVEPDYVAPAVGAMSGGAFEPRAASAPAGGGLPDTLCALAPLLRTGAVSPVELVERALDRIAERDGELNAFQLVLDDRARAEARQAEAEIARGAWRGPLHGVPVAVKDLLDVAGTVTTGGGRRASWPPAARDAPVVAGLRQAGAILIGKTRLPEYAFWPGSINPHYGPTANPHDPTRDAGGSSSGSAAAVADHMAWAALGTDTGGSIRIPAALCGVVGLKPTYGRVSLEGCIPLAWSLDHAGPLARSVEDAGVLLGVMAGAGGAGSAQAPASPRAGGAASAEPLTGSADLSGMRVGVLGDDGTDRALASDEALEQWRRSLRALEAAGATLAGVDLPEMATLRAVNFLILSVEAAGYHASGLRERYDDYGEPCRSRLLAGFAYDAHDLVRAQRKRREIRLRWSRLFERVDLLCTPSQPDVAPALGEMGSVKFTSPFNALGWPALSVPFGIGRGGLPLATQLVGPPWGEEIVLRAGGALEKAG